MAITRAVEAHPFNVSVAHWRRWRADDDLIRAQLTPDPSDEDPVIGRMATPIMAYDVALAHNRTLEDVQ